MSPLYLQRDAAYAKPQTITAVIKKANGAPATVAHSL
jgi:hypothetical protein